MTFAQLRTSFAKFIHDSNVDTTERDFWINEAYRKLVGARDWDWAKDFYAAALVAYQGNYALPSRWRKWKFLKMNNVELEQVLLGDFNKPREDWFETEDVARNHFSVNRADDNILIDPIPTSASDSTTTSNAEAAGSAVVIQVPDTSGIEAGKFVYISGVSGGSSIKEITSVSAVVADTSFTVARLKRSYDAGATVIPIEHGLYGEFFILPNDLSAASDEPIAPARLHLSIAKLAAHLYYASLEHENLANYWLGEYNRDIGEEWNDEMPTAEYYTL